MYIILLSMTDKHSDPAEHKEFNETLRDALERAENAQTTLWAQNQELAILLRIANMFLTDSNQNTHQALVEIISEELESPLGSIDHLAVIQERPLTLTQIRQSGSWDRDEVHLRPPRDRWAEKARKARRTITDGDCDAEEGIIPIRCVMSVPMILSSDVIGSITVANRHSGYDRSSQEILESISVFIAPIIEHRTRRRQQELKRIKEQKSWAEAKVARGAALSLRNVLDAIEKEARSARAALETGRPASAILGGVIRQVSAGQEVIRRLGALGHTGTDVAEPLDLNQIIAESVDQIRKRVGLGVEIDFKREADLDPILADGRGTHLVVTELLGNAVDALASERRIHIETSVVQITEQRSEHPIRLTQGKYARLTITDSGIGIEPDVQKLIFEPFFTTKERGKGAGLGLSAALSIVRAGGGEIDVVSAPGQGTTITVYFPLAKKDTRIPRKQGAEPASILPATILVVDDEPVSLQFMTEVLTRYGYDVLEAQSGEQALELVERHQGAIDLLICDIVMAPINGPELVGKLATSYPDLPVVYVSGYPGDWLSLQGSLSEEEMFLEKPFDSITLRKAVNVMLLRRAAQS
jgi:signal transduction histidine kinase